MTSTDLDTVQRSLAQLAQFAPLTPSCSPLYTPAQIWCEVDEDLSVHVVVTIPASTDPGGDHRRTLNLGELRPVEGAVIRDGVADPFMPITPPLFSPGLPVMAARPGAGYLIAFRGLAERDAQAAKLRAYDAMVTAEDAHGAAPWVAARKVSFALRMSVAPSGTVFVLGQEWAPPQSQPASIPLWLVAAREGQARTIASPIHGTDTSGSQPSDVALHASADGRVHVVYDGVRSTPRGQPHRYHLILDGANGELLATHNLGLVEHRAVRTAIVPSPGGELFFAAVSERRDAPGTLVHTLDRLAAGDTRGAKDRYLVDFWLRAHRVRFDAGDPRFEGPAAIPSF